jgi:hypothetical protein
MLKELASVLTMVSLLDSTLVCNVVSAATKKEKEAQSETGFRDHAKDPAVLPTATGIKGISGAVAQSSRPGTDHRYASGGSDR